MTVGELVEHLKNCNKNVNIFIQKEYTDLWDIEEVRNQMIDEKNYYRAIMLGDKIASINTETRRKNMLTKSELILKVKTDLGDTVSKKDIENVIDAFYRVAAKALAKGENVKLTDIGVLKTVEVAEKNGRNPATGKPIKIPAHKTVRFRISKMLKEKLQ